MTQCHGQTATEKSSLQLTVLVKKSAARSRPPRAKAVSPQEGGYSLPSGHSLNSASLAGMTIYLLLGHEENTSARRLGAALAITFTITIGLGRAYLGHHWLSDILTAWVLGLVWVGVVITGHRLYLRLRQHEGGE